MIWLLVGNLTGALMMTGLILFVQIVHYPLFADVGENESVEYARRHARLTTYVVGPVMAVELACAAGLVLLRPGLLVWTGFGLVILIWLSTAVLQVPCHSRLALGFDPRVHRRLVRGNWIRTVAWTVRSIIAVALILEQTQLL